MYNLKTREMNKLYLFFMMGFMLAGNLYAQEEDTVTDEELRKYAEVMAWADDEKEDLEAMYNDLIRENELMNGGKRFVEIKGAIDDSVKLAELEVSEEEMIAYNKIEEENEANVAKFKEVYTEKIKDKEVLGASTYNKVGKALKNDEEVKARYEEILAEVKMSSEDDDGEESEEYTK